MHRKFVAKVVDFAARFPFAVLFLTLLLLVGTNLYSARNLQFRSEFLELLPRDSPGFKAYEHQRGRVGGGATLVLVVESPDRASNERFVDSLATELEDRAQRRKDCLAGCKTDTCRTTCGPDLVSYVESGTKDVRAFYERNKWLYAEREDLEKADETLDHQIAIRGGLVERLDDEETPSPPDAPPVAVATAAAGGATVGAMGATGAHPVPKGPEKKHALGMDEFRARWKSKAKSHDDFPSGYFATEDGTMLGIRIVSNSGLGDARGDQLLSEVQALVDALGPTKFHPEMKVGFAGDISNAAAEKASLVSEAAWATAMAFVLILGGVVVFYRSLWSVFVIAIPALVGVSCAYAFATVTYGYVNTSGLFLGAIILGNGINYPIVLLARYQEFRARGMEPAEARVQAVLNAFRAELVGALVASIAYGSLTITRFRGFNQFGVIGFVGMLLVWLSIVPLVPALVVLIERLQGRLPRVLRDPPYPVDADGTHGSFTRVVAFLTGRFPWAFIVLGLLLTGIAATRIPNYLKDPWEYDFGKLGSRGSSQTGAGAWSNKADRVFGGKMNIAGALMLADTPEQVPLVKAKILENDRSDPKGSLIADVATIYDLLPGSLEEQNQKLAVLERIRERLTPAVLHGLSPEERAEVEEIRPPEDLVALTPKDLPPLLRRRFTENDGRIGTVFYVKIRNDVSLSDGHNQLRIAHDTDNLRLPDGTLVQTASNSTIFAEMLRSMERDGPLATLASFLAVLVVVVVATSSLKGAMAVIASLLMGVVWTVGGAAYFQQKLNYINFIALPITFGIGCEYPFNIFDRSRLLGGDVTQAVKRSGGAVILCSYTTVVGYGSLLYSDFQALESFGRLAVSGEVACIFAALFFLPSLLHLLNRGRVASTSSQVVPSVSGGP